VLRTDLPQQESLFARLLNLFVQHRPIVVLQPEAMV